MTSKYSLLPETEFIEMRKQFISSSVDDKVENAEHLYWNLKCAANHKGMDITDLYMLALYMKKDIELKCPQVLTLNEAFEKAEQNSTSSEGEVVS